MSASPLHISLHMVIMTTERCGSGNYFQNIYNWGESHECVASWTHHVGLPNWSADNDQRQGHGGDL